MNRDKVKRRLIFLYFFFLPENVMFDFRQNRLSLLFYCIGFLIRVAFLLYSKKKISKKEIYVNKCVLFVQKYSVAVNAFPAIGKNSVFSSS